MNLTTKKNWIEQVVLLGLCVVVFASASAAESKKKKKSTKKTDVVESLRYKQGDERSNDIRALKTEILIARSEKLAIEQAKRLLKKYKGHPIEPELYYRLAELYMRRSKSERFFEINRDSKEIASLAPQIIKKASSKRLVGNAVRIYDKIERPFPNFEGMDLVLFNNGFARPKLNQQNKAERLYWKVVKKYPHSPLVPDCHLAIGEMAFRQGRFKFALKQFQAIKKYPESRVYPYGLYKSAWTFYNLRDAYSGIKELEKVVLYGKYVSDNKVEAKLDLRKEALGDMTIFFEDVYPSSEAYSYFKRQAGELDFGPTLMRLARLYKAHSRHSDQRVVLQAFVDKMPLSELIPKVQNDLVWNFEGSRQRKGAVAQLEKFYDTCDPASKWAKAQPLPEPIPKQKVASAKGKAQPQEPTAVEVCQKKLESTSRSLAGKWLRTWRKNKGYPMFADVAERAFEIYLRRNPTTAKASDARFAYAELLFQRNKYALASSQYELVGQHSKNKKQAHDSRYASLLSLEKSVKKNKWTEEQEGRFKRLTLDYVKHHPKGKFRLDIEFRMALTAYEKGRYQEASPIFLRLGESYAKLAKGLKSQDLYLDILNINKDYAGLKSYSKKLRDRAGKKNLKRIAKLSKIYEESYFLQVQGMEEDKKYKKAIVEYKRFAKQNSSSTLAKNAWWNALQLHFKVSDFSGGAKAAVDYYQRFPSSKEAVDALLRAAQTYESMGQLGPAAGVLILLSKADKASSQKWKALAADYYVLNGDPRRAKPIYKDQLKTAKGDLKFQALEKLTKLEEKHGSTKEHRKLLRSLVAWNRQPQASMAKLVFVKELFETKQYPKAFTEAKVLLKMGKKASPHALATARFIQAQILEDEFRRQSVKSKLDRVAIVLALKTEKLEKAQRAYQSAIRYGDPHVAVSSLQRLAGCYDHYTKALRNMPLPEGLTEQDAPPFRNELEQLAIPMEEKSVETIAQALEQARKLEMRDGTVVRMQKELDKVNMVTTLEPLVEVSPPSVVVPGFASKVGS